MKNKTAITALLLLALTLSNAEAATPAPSTVKAYPVTTVQQGVRYSGCTIYGTSPFYQKGWWADGYVMQIEYNGNILGSKAVRNGDSVYGFKSTKRYFLRFYTRYTNGRSVVTGGYYGVWFKAP